MYKLLIVDDEQIIREGLESMIDWDGLGLVKTAVCSNAFSALDSMTDDMPDILMTDVRMPGMDGLELTERAMALHPQLRVIILSGYDTFSYAQQAMKAGVMEYLLKPCSRDEVEEALVRACRAIDKARMRVTYLYEERQERIRAMAEQLKALQMSGMNADDIEHHVHELARTEVEPSLLREALVYLITAGADENPAQWKLNAIMGAFDSELEPLEHHIAATLSGMQVDTGSRGFVRKMTDYVDAHYSEEALSLQYIADNVVYMNADYIGREFARTVGRKFSAYLLEVRMEHAKALMAADSTMRSYEVATRVGLGNNPHYFSQVFRKYTGMPPKEYRASLTEDRQG